MRLAPYSACVARPSSRVVVSPPMSALVTVACTLAVRHLDAVIIRMLYTMRINSLLEVTGMARDGYRPLREFMSLRDGMDRLFEDRWISPGNWLTWSSPSSSSYLPLDIYETPDDLVVRAVVPGVTPEGIDVQFQAGVLTIRANSEEASVPDGATWLVREITPGEYIRQVTLPRTIEADGASSTFEHGVLTLTLPKSGDAKPKQIKVRSERRVGAGQTDS